MKNLVLPFIVGGSLLSAIVFGPAAQKTKVLPDNTRLTYTVDDKNNLSGAYYVESTEKSVILRGVYADNKRSGNWYCFNGDKTVFLRYNYDAKKLLFLDTVALKRAEITIADKDPNALAGASVPLPVCSIDQFISLLTEGAKEGYPKELINYGVPADLNIIAIVKSADNVKYRATYMYQNKLYGYDIKLDASAFKIDWIPSTYKGKDIEAEFKVATKVTFSPDQEQRRFRWN